MTLPVIIMLKLALLPDKLQPTLIIFPVDEWQRLIYIFFDHIYIHNKKETEKKLKKMNNFRFFPYKPQSISSFIARKTKISADKISVDIF